LETASEDTDYQLLTGSLQENWFAWCESRGLLDWLFDGFMTSYRIFKPSRSKKLHITKTDLVANS